MNLIKAAPSKSVNTFLDKYSEMFPIDKQFAQDIISQTLRHRNSSKKNPIPLPRYTVELEERWLASIRRREPDYSVYDDDYAFTEMWVCWAIYSRGYLRTLLKPLVQPLVSDIKTIADLGCGIGYTTGSLKQIFSNSNVIGTNVIGTRQYEFCSAMSRSYNFDMASRINELGRTDLVFASEYFEHLISPIEHLKEIIEMLNPRLLYIANSFNTRSVGHFEYYLIGKDRLSAAKAQKIFNRTLKDYGYGQLDINAWNNKPALWVRQ